VPAVYLHPVGLDGALWGSVAEPGALTPSFPGFGDTPPLPGPPSFAALVDFVAGAVAGSGPVDLVGVSLGSMVAQHVAVRRPELVRSLVLACGGLATATDALLERAAATRRGGMAGVLDSTLERWFTAPALAEPGHPGVAYARTRLLTDSAEVFAAYWEQMSAHDLAGQLPAVRVPTTVVAGDVDVSAPIPVMRLVADAIPGARFEVVPGPHLLPLENPAGFAATVREHLDRVAA
jgi:3-oxoadipate enol-lactonase